MEPPNDERGPRPACWRESEGWLCSWAWTHPPDPRPESDAAAVGWLEQRKKFDAGERKRPASVKHGDESAIRVVR
jgi:hypothetical protein